MMIDKTQIQSEFNMNCHLLSRLQMEEAYHFQTYDIPSCCCTENKKNEIASMQDIYLPLTTLFGITQQNLSIKKTINVLLNQSY